MKDYEKLSKAHFNGQAAEYDRNESIHYSKYPKISCKNVSGLLADKSFAKLLDIGCGTGYLIDMLKKQHKDTVYYGLDLSPEMLKNAKKKFDDSVYLKEGSAMELPYDNNCFDIVTCIQSFHHYPDPEKAMAEAYRVTAHGGLYILSDTGCGGAIKWIENHMLLKMANTGDYQVSSRQDMEKLMKSAGFEIVKSEQIEKMIYTVVGKKPSAK